ncbi:DHH family phosphoesterase [Allosphingosinicella deserti]|uniref:Phosphoesterase n=1 Tax=Allosphingosinicella deserti TaxID=2116704 RepID=A0A2P7QJN6_9SPHN|nr:DHH family phosphoesterase [Sphingomonas deserti]PSJ38161.1 phosphoesterase [Sphingomonas deserti]
MRTREAGETGKAFAEAVRSFAPERPPLVLGHFDADGLASIAILARALERSGRPAEIRIVGKGETVWSEAMRAELADRRPGGLVVADLGVRERAVLDGVPTILVDHHVPSGAPGDALVLSGNGLDPEPTSALIAYWCAQGLGAADDLLWLAAMGLIGDMAEAAGFPELAAAQARYGKTALRNAVALVNAPRRTGAADARPALALLLACDSPKELLSGARPETALLHAAKQEVACALDGARRVAPKIRGDVALIRFESPCQIHPLIAQQWRGRLRDRIVIAANSGYRAGWVHFAARSAGGQDLIAFLDAHRPAGADGQYGNGHRQATGGALPIPVWNAFVTELGFPEEQLTR